jgi:hypothetical protein
MCPMATNFCIIIREIFIALNPVCLSEIWLLTSRGHIATFNLFYLVLRFKPFKRPGKTGTPGGLSRNESGLAGAISITERRCGLG